MLLLVFFLRAIQNTYMQCNHHADFFLNLSLVVRKVTGRLEKVNFFILIMTDTIYHLPKYLSFIPNHLYFKQPKRSVCK